ncbi:glycosyltransferase family A protein [Vibrio sp. SA48]
MTPIKQCSVSVVIPFYNAANSVELTLQSVFRQSSLPLEIIIVNDASNNEDYLALVNLVDKLSNDSLPIFLHSINLNKGASFCRNVAITHAKGKYLAFLDADDVWHKHKLEVQYAFMERSNAILSGHGYIYNLNSESFSEFEGNSELAILQWNFIYKNPFLLLQLWLEEIPFHYLMTVFEGWMIISAGLKILRKIGFFC